MQAAKYDRPGRRPGGPPPGSRCRVACAARWSTPTRPVLDLAGSGRLGSRLSPRDAPPSCGWLCAPGRCWPAGPRRPGSRRPGVDRPAAIQPDGCGPLSCGAWPGCPVHAGPLDSSRLPATQARLPARASPSPGHLRSTADYPADASSPGNGHAVSAWAGSRPGPAEGGRKAWLAQLLRGPTRNHAGRKATCRVRARERVPRVSRRHRDRGQGREGAQPRAFSRPP